MAFADQLDEMVERIIDEAIKFYLYVHNWRLADDGNYHTSEMGTDYVMTPPGNPVRTAGGQVTGTLGSPMPWICEYGSDFNTGSLIYAHFETTIREMFRPWRSIPTPSDFDPYLDILREAAWYVSLTSTGDKVSDVGNAKLTAVDFLQKKIGGDDMGGNMILTFDQNFCTPLPTVIQGQYAVALLAGITLCGEKEVWAGAQRDVLAIADKMHAAMKDRGAAVAHDLSTVTALFSLAAVFPTPAQPILAGVGTVLPALESLIKAGDEPSKPTVEFAGGTPEKVVGKAEEALKKLAQAIRGCEDDIKGKIKGAMEAVTSRSGSFDMPTPKLLGETKVGEMKVDLDDLRFLATDTLPQIEQQLNAASDGLSFGSMRSEAWYRPTEIGASDTTDGPYQAWSALVSLAEGLVINLAWEVRESAAHLEIATDRIGQTEAQAEESLRRHAEKLDGGSGRDPIGKANWWLNENR